MNKDNVCLVKIDEFRHVSVSSYGSILMSWDRVTLDLDKAEMLLLAETLQDEVPFENELSSPPRFLDGDEYEYEEGIQLWLGDVAFMLNAIDFEIFTDMVLLAAGQIESKVEKSSGSYAARLGFGSDIEFSLN